MTPEMGPGVDALAQQVAWWLAHPWRVLGFYLLAQAIVSVVRGFLGALLGPVDEPIK